MLRPLIRKQANATGSRNQQTSNTPRNTPGNSSALSLARAGKLDPKKQLLKWLKKLLRR